MSGAIEIQGRRVGAGSPVYVVAEMSANHGGSLERAMEIVRAAKAAGADAVKLQTYTPDTMTIPAQGKEFLISGGTLWDGQTLYELYRAAFTPWEWQPRLKALADELGLHLFSSAFDAKAVDFLEDMGVPAYKVASFELVDLPLIERMARTGKPLIMSTGMATLGEIAEAVEAARAAGASQVALLKCTSAYPAPPEDMNLRTIPHLAEAFGVPAGLSDHTLGITVPAAAVSLGGCIVEKHLTLSRQMAGPDSAFSLEPGEFRAMVDAIRTVERALGGVAYGTTAAEIKSRAFRRSLFVVRDMQVGEPFTEANVRSIRPGHGLPPKVIRQVLGRRARGVIASGTPLRWDLIS
jgi:N-acetylneuraminate synthase